MSRRLRVLATLLVTLSAAACGTSDPTAPSSARPIAEPTASPQLLSIPQRAVGVLWATPRATAATASAYIGPTGGTIELKASGLRITIPKYALLTTTRISVTALPGKVVAYDFQPHGTVFLAPIRLEQDYRLFSSVNTNYSSFDVTYFADRSLLDVTGGTALVSEALPLVTDLVTSRVKFDVRHFSGYMISSGRR